MINSEEIDVVYVFKNVGSTEELKYSIRSVAENWSHRKIWIIGDRPLWINDNVGFIRTYGNNKNRYSDVNSKLRFVCRDRRISNPFWLFNDDFFILDKMDVSSYKVFYEGTLEEKEQRLRDKFPSLKTWRYVEGFPYAKKVLKINKCTSFKNFETHVPMLVYKKEMKKVLDAYPDCVCRRSIYMNLYHQDEGEPHCDVKRYEKNSIVRMDDVLVSTDENTFKGQVGDYIKNKFNKRSIYER